MSIPINFSNPIINEKNKDQIEIYIYIGIEWWNWKQIKFLRTGKRKEK